MTTCTPPITIEQLVKEIAPNCDFDYVSYRIFLGHNNEYKPDSETIFAGCFAISYVNGLHINSLDGDTYSLGENVLAYEQWISEKDGINNGLTIVVSSLDEQQKGIIS